MSFFINFWILLIIGLILSTRIILFIKMGGTKTLIILSNKYMDNVISFIQKVHSFTEAA